MRILKHGTGYHLTIPQAWIRANCTASDAYLYCVENERGNLELIPERKFYEQKFRQHNNASNNGAGEADPRKN